VGEVVVQGSRGHERRDLREGREELFAQAVEVGLHGGSSGSSSGRAKSSGSGSPLALVTADEGLVGVRGGLEGDKGENKGATASPHVLHTSHPEGARHTTTIFGRYLHHHGPFLLQVLAQGNTTHLTIEGLLILRQY